MLILVSVPWRPIVLALGLLSGLILIEFVESSLLEHRDPFAIKEAARVILEQKHPLKSVPNHRSSAGY
jgi:hypothetical protein